MEKVCYFIKINVLLYILPHLPRRQRNKRRREKNLKFMWSFRQFCIRHYFHFGRGFSEMLADIISRKQKYLSWSFYGSDKGSYYRTKFSLIFCALQNAASRLRGIFFWFARYHDKYYKVVARYPRIYLAKVRVLLFWALGTLEGWKLHKFLERFFWCK